jgi:NAD+ diphosphatase
MPNDDFVPALTPPQGPIESALWFAFAGGNVLLAQRPAAAPGVPPDPRALAIPQLRDLAELGLHPERTIYLGALAGVPCFAADLPESTDAPAGHQLVSLFVAYRTLPIENIQLAGRAAQLLHFERTWRYCPACATALEPRGTDRARRCPRCERDYYPPVSPAVIVLVHDGRRALLTRQARFPAGMYTTVAGFLEPGETLEQCVAREVLEETGVSVRDVRYFGSQPWPFPHQVMVGFIARYASGELVVDTTELEDARWFELDALPALPPRVSIARALIEAWRAEQDAAGP